MDCLGPPWLAVQLIAPFLDANSLSNASCVSKSWNSIFSNDHLWSCLCLSSYPSSQHLMPSTDNLITHRRLFFLLYTASRRQIPCLCSISLKNIIFTVDVFCGEEVVLSLAIPAKESPKGIFRFDVEVEDSSKIGYIDTNNEKELRVMWMVVMKDFRGAFMMTDSSCEGRSLGEKSWWFWQQVRSSYCRCRITNDDSFGLQSEVLIEVCDGNEGKRKRIRRLRLGLMSTQAWRYLSVDDGLHYLQRFFVA